MLGRSAASLLHRYIVAVLQGVGSFGYEKLQACERDRKAPVEAGSRAKAAPNGAKGLCILVPHHSTLEFVSSAGEKDRLDRLKPSPAELSKPTLEVAWANGLIAFIRARTFHLDRTDPAQAWKRANNGFRNDEPSAGQ